MFFSFDGMDGTGKTTQRELFCRYLRDAGYEVVECRDPGSTDVGEAIRELLLGGAVSPIGARCEMLLFMAARAQLVDDVIRPALERGQAVVSDRFLLANIVYQGYAGGLGAEAVRQVGQCATEGVTPDLTFVLDMPVSDAAARIRRERDRMEQQSDDYQQKLRQGYLAEARRAEASIAVLDAARPVEVVQSEIRQLARSLVPPR